MGEIMSKSCSFLFLLSGDKKKASSRVRGFWVAESLRTKGYRCALLTCSTRLKLILSIFIIPFHKVIIFQKCYSRWHYLLLIWAHFFKKVTIFDLDDAPSRNENKITLNNAELMMSNASSVVVGSNELYKYASKYAREVLLVPSCVRLEDYPEQVKVPRNEKPICLGWIGNGTHYKEDIILMLAGPIAELSKSYQVKFKLIGACGEPELYHAFRSIPGLEIDFIDHIAWNDPKSVFKALSEVDIGLYPLLENNFNQYKCGFKALEYMAFSLPVVGSVHVSITEIVGDGEDGFLVSTESDWIKKISLLIERPEIRYLMGQNGRKKVSNTYSTHIAVKKILDKVLGVI
jgi:glycosyltransferase involved in cell wall biosynthesis